MSGSSTNSNTASHHMDVQMSPCGGYLVRASNDGVITIYKTIIGEDENENLIEFSFLQSLYGHNGAVWRVCWGNERTLASVSHDKTVRVWKYVSSSSSGEDMWRCIGNYELPAAATHVSFANKSLGEYLIVCNQEKVFLIHYLTHTVREVRIIEHENCQITAVAFVPYIPHEVLSETTSNRLLTNRIGSIVSGDCRGKLVYTHLNLADNHVVLSTIIPTNPNAKGMNGSIVDITVDPTFQSCHTIAIVVKTTLHDNTIEYEGRVITGTKQIPPTNSGHTTTSSIEWRHEPLDCASLHNNPVWAISFSNTGSLLTLSVGESTTLTFTRPLFSGPITAFVNNTAEVMKHPHEYMWQQLSI